jgi:hypothetical protein
LVFLVGLWSPTPKTRTRMAQFESGLVHNRFILNRFLLFTNQTDARGIEFGGATEAAPFQDWRCDKPLQLGLLGFDADAR